MFARVQLSTFAVCAVVLPALALIVAPTNEHGSLALLGVVAASVVFALIALQTTRRLPLLVARSGPPPAAQRRRRGSFLRQSHPDTAGRPRPRAPGLADA